MNEMNEQDYLQQLSLLLSDLPEQEKENALNFVQEYFEEAKASGSNAAASLGSPSEYAKGIREGLKDSLPPRIPAEPVQKSAADFMEKPQNPAPSSSYTPKKGMPFWLVLVLMIVLMPIWVPLLLAGLILLAMLALTVVMLVLMACLLVLVFAVTLFAMLYKGAALLAVDPLGSLFDFGLAMLSFCLAWFGWLGLKALFTRALPPFFAWMGHAFAAFFKKTRDFFSRILNPNNGGYYR